MYSFVGALIVGIALGEPVGVATGVVNLYVTGASFASDVVIAVGFVASFRSVTDEYGCKLRKGLFVAGLSGVVDTLWTCFCFFLLLCVIHRFAYAIGCCYLVPILCCRPAYTMACCTCL